MTSPPQLSDLSASELRNAVATRYGRVATDPGEGFNFPVGRQFAEAIGYPPALLDQLPETVSQSFAGVAYLPGWVEPPADARVVDLGCGAGLDSLIVAKQLSAGGELIGIDYSAEMVALARSNARAAGQEHLRIVQATVEDVPLVDATADLVIANGIFNLSPEKEQIVSEIARVLKPGGNMTAAEIVLTEEIPATERSTLDDWFR